MAADAPSRPQLPEDADADVAPATNASPASALRLPGGEEVPLAGAAGRLFGSELASLHRAASSKLAARKAAAAAGGAGSDSDLAVFHATLVGLQALRAQAAADAAAAAAALGGVLGRVAAAAEEAFGSDVIYQITLLGDAPGASEVAEPSAGAEERAAAPEQGLAAWKRAARRSLMEGERGWGGCVWQEGLRWRLQRCRCMPCLALG